MSHSPKKALQKHQIILLHSCFALTLYRCVLGNYLISVAELLSFSFFLYAQNLSLHNLNVLFQLSVVLFDHRVENLVPLSILTEHLLQGTCSVLVQILAIVLVKRFFLTETLHVCALGVDHAREHMVGDDLCLDSFDFDFRVSQALMAIWFSLGWWTLF